jgi:DNA mismatch repair protein MutS
MGAGHAETPLEDWVFAPDHAIPLLENHFGVLSLEGFGLAGKPAAASAAGAILYYVRSTQRGNLNHVDRIGFYERQNCLVLDAVTVRNLELIEPLFAGTDVGVTLSRSIDVTVTPMGKRLLRSWILRPSIEKAEINARLDAVEAQVKDTIAREELRRALDGILDLERLLSRVTSRPRIPAMYWRWQLHSPSPSADLAGPFREKRLQTLHVRGRVAICGANRHNTVPEPPFPWKGRNPEWRSRG